jgi:hypothetical protein
MSVTSMDNPFVHLSFGFTPSPPDVDNVSVEKPHAMESSQSELIDLDSNSVITVDADMEQLGAYPVAPSTSTPTGPPPPPPSTPPPQSQSPLPPFSSPPHSHLQSSRGKSKAPASPAGGKTHKRRHVSDRPATDFAALADIMKTQFSTMKSDLSEQQTTQTAALQQQFQKQYEAYQNETKILHQQVQAQDGRLSILEDQQSNVTSKILDLQKRVVELESWMASDTRPPPPTPDPTPSSLSFPDKVSQDLAARIEKDRVFQAANVNSFVVFKANEHIPPEQKPETFAQLVANTFGGPTASVESVTWIGADRNHLKINLSLPLAEAIGNKFWADRQALRVKYFLAPCRSKLLRDAMYRMRVTASATRNLRPELLVEKISATSIRFMGTDLFDATDFLYPAIRLRDGRIIPVSHIVNTPHISSIPLVHDATLSVPEPTYSP